MGFGKRFFEINIKSIFYLLLSWLSLGYFLGTLTLIGPVRWAINYAAEHNWAQSDQDLLVKGIIVGLVIISFISALFVTRLLVLSEGYFKKFLVFFVLAALSGFSVWLWVNPKLIQADIKNTAVVKNDGTEFVFGQYPDEYELRELKKNNFTAVISLLHEAVVPFEPKLLKDEIEACERVGIELINIPMLPWISSNEGALNELRALSQSARGKYFVHCYLGKDRVNLAKRIIEITNSSAKIASNLNSRSIEELGKFERGEIIKLEEGVYVTPFPTDDEFVGYILNGSFKNIVSLFNPEDPADTSWTNKETKLCSTFDIPLHYYPLTERTSGKTRLAKLAEKIGEMDRPVLIHAYFSDSPYVKKFIDYYNSSILKK
ncbi:MAG: hypothetical protein CVV24_03745 [Ignavibacteriae bacterium HGW-Ignavibacteriae-3]|nr:MAG: hypothetical protein CVV24_03745 [Ignavibacteriae bacterium HGW-Ignavibacteriae-3]